jgi:hypothetical protein
VKRKRPKTHENKTPEASGLREEADETDPGNGFRVLNGKSHLTPFHLEKALHPRGTLAAQPHIVFRGADLQAQGR